MHPNVPAPGDGLLIVGLRRAKLMYWAILAPELIVIWAMRQWLAACVVKKRFEGASMKNIVGEHRSRYFKVMGGL